MGNHFFLGCESGLGLGLILLNRNQRIVGLSVVSTKCSDLSLVVLLVWALILNMKLSLLWLTLDRIEHSLVCFYQWSLSITFHLTGALIPPHIQITHFGLNEIELILSDVYIKPLVSDMDHLVCATDTITMQIPICPLLFTKKLF